MAWEPQPGPQAEAIVCTWCTELFFGGARGGGKSDYLLADYLQDVGKYGRNWQGVIFRRTYPELQEIVKRSQDLYKPTGATWREQDKEWRWPNGATLHLRYLEHSRDASRYQGHEYQWIGFDELTQWPSDEGYRMIMACLRCSRAEVATKRIRASGNPGGPGHQWVKARFIDAAPLGLTPIQDPITGMWRMYVPARVTDNKILLSQDPSYVERLKGVGSAALVRSWLDGDWNQISGAYYTEFNEAHIVHPHEIPSTWTKFRSLDWGSSRPFSVGWYAISDGTREYPKNAIIKYREWYGASAPNVGLKLPVEMVAQGILARGPEKIDYSIADPAIFQSDGGPSIAETFKTHGVLFRPGDNKRIAGWEQIRSRLVGEDNRPMLFFFSTCRDTIRTLPSAQHDSVKAEDIDTDGEDHALDELRYACMSRPYVKPNQVAKKPRTVHEMTLNDLWQSNKHRRENRV